MTTTITPTFWDLHLHGIAGIDFMHADHDAMVHASEMLGQHGIGFFAPTLLTTEPKLLLEACSRWGRFLVSAQRKGFLPRKCAAPLGLHLEGPFLNPSMAGAHPRKALKRPDVTAVLQLLAAARGHVAIVTLAPELPGSRTVIRALRKRGVRVQMGHSQASTEDALTAVRAGVQGITHLYNAMRTHHRDPGVLTALIRGLVTAEIITDGVHISPDFLHWCVLASDKLYAVSDGCSAVGCRSGRGLTLGSLQIKRRGDVAVVTNSDINERASHESSSLGPLGTAHSLTLAGGATFLTEHPQRLAMQMPASRLLPLFYHIQQSLFPSFAKTHRRHPRNHFDRRSLRFLGVE